MPEGKFNINSLMLLVALGALGWLANKTTGNNDVLVSIQAQLPYVQTAVTDLKSQIGALVTRAELDSRIAEMAAKNAALEKRVLVIELRPVRKTAQAADPEDGPPP